MPRCSVVIPWNRNVAELRRAVDSIFAQDEQDFEIVVAANGVDDAAFAEIETLYADPRYRTTRCDEPGAAHARNVGSDAATGDLVFFLDADDRFRPTKLSRFLEFHRTHGFDLAFSRGTRVRQGGVTWPWPVGYWDGTRPIAEFFFCDGCSISSSAIVVTAAAKSRIRFAELHKPYDDPDLLIRAEHEGLDIKMLPDTLYDWHDDRYGQRLSQLSNWDKRLSWIDQTPPNVSEKARAAFRARCVAQHMFPERFFDCLGYFARALWTRGSSPRDVMLFAVRGLVPADIRELLLNYYYLERAAIQSRRDKRQRAAAPAGHFSEAPATKSDAR